MFNNGLNNQQVRCKQRMQINPREVGQNRFEIVLLKSDINQYLTQVLPKLMPLKYEEGKYSSKNIYE